jgi:hypothetical protein
LSGSGRPSCLQISFSIFSSDTSSPSVTIFSPTITAGATGRSRSKYSSVLYSALGLDMISISMLYFSPSLGMIFLKCFHGFPLGSFKKKLILSIFASLKNIHIYNKTFQTLLPDLLCLVHTFKEWFRGFKIHQAQFFDFFAFPVQENNRGNPSDMILF